MTLVATIANELLQHRAVLALPRPTVMADVRERFGCSDHTARDAYALARVESRVPHRRNTVPQRWRA